MLQVTRFIVFRQQSFDDMTTLVAIVTTGVSGVGGGSCVSHHSEAKVTTMPAMDISQLL
jgi:hypothetical protein